MTVFPAGRTVVDREQAKKDADEELSGESRRSPLSAAHSLARHCLALLAELEQAERERDDALHGRALARADTENERRLLVDAEARLARVPALVEALRQWPEKTAMAFDALRLWQLADETADALAEWEQA